MKLKLKGIGAKVQAVALLGVGSLAAEAVTNKVAPEVGLDPDLAPIVPLALSIFGPDFVKGRTGSTLKPVFDGMGAYAAAELVRGFLPDNVKSQMGIAGLYESSRATYQAAVGGYYGDAATSAQYGNSAVS